VPSRATRFKGHSAAACVERPAKFAHQPPRITVDQVELAEQASRRPPGAASEVGWPLLRSLKNRNGGCEHPRS